MEKTRCGIYPVIHCIDPFTMEGIGHALQNARICFESGAQGIFLIGHSITYRDLLYIYEHIQKAHPERFIGLNFLDVKKPEMLQTALSQHSRLSGFWMDNVVPGCRRAVGEVPIWGGIAFKYINPNPSNSKLIAQVERLKNERVDFAVTSGDSTGSPPSTEKLVGIRKVMTLRALDTPLVVASGVSIKNIDDMLPHIDAVLVASSISERRNGCDWIVPQALLDLVRRIECFQA